MKKLLTLTLLSSIFLTGCSVDWNDKEEFNNKLKCESYSTKIEKDLEDRGLVKFNLSEIFYSKKVNSCIYVVKSMHTWEINDYLSKKEILRTDSFVGCVELDAKKDETKCKKETTDAIENKIKELKGE